MNWTGMTKVSLLVLAAMAALALGAWFHLPAGTQLPVHWNGAGQADGFAPAGRALAMPVLIAGGVSLIMMLVPRIEPLQQRMGESAPFYRAVWLGLLALFALIQAMVTLPAFGLHLPGELIFVAVGIFFMLMGNLLPKTRPSFFVGIRTPWTLSDPENWIATHRFGGRTMMAGGLLLCFVAFAPATVRTQLLLTAIGIGVVPPVLYSYLYWRRHRAG